MAKSNLKSVISILLILIDLSVKTVFAIHHGSASISPRELNSTRTNGNFRQEYPSPTRIRTSPRPVKPARLPSSVNRLITATTDNTTSTPTVSTTTIGSRGTDNSNLIAKPTLLGVTSTNHTDITPSATSSNADGEDELLCLLKLYTDIVVEDKVTNIGHIDIDNNRLIFLIPLIIIYWHHRHPRDMIPFNDLEILLKELGDEARVHRRILNHMILRVDECYLDSSGRLTIAFEDDNPSAILLYNKRRQEQQARAAEALRVLDAWLSDRNANNQAPDYDKLREDIQKNPKLYTSLSLRRSSAREIRHWFESFLNLNYSNRLKHKDRPTTTTAEQIRLVNATTEISETTSVGYRETKNSESITTANVTEGVVHYDTTTIKPSFDIDPERSNVTDATSTTLETEVPFIIDTIKDQRNVAQMIRNSSHTDTTNGRPLQLSLLNSSQNNEFFDLVSSILMEMDTINNSTNLSL